MAEILFYHLTRTPLEATLPELLEKSLARGWKALVKTGDAERLDWLDRMLWLANEGSFLPHGKAGDGREAEQPVLIGTTGEAPNGAEVLFIVDGAEIGAEEARRFQRACILFDGNDGSATERARAQWKDLTGAGLAAKYWSQESGAWKMTAESG